MCAAVTQGCQLRNACDAHAAYRAPNNALRNQVSFCTLSMAGQIIRNDTPASALELNYPAGGPKYGWRVKSGNDFKNYVHAEYTAFWHHPNGIGYGAAGWTQAPPPDNASDTNGSTPAPGSADPRDGSFGGGSGTITSVATTTSGNVTTITTTYSDGTKKTEVRTQNPDGSTTIVTTYPDGNTTTITISDSRTVSGADESGTRPRSGRVSWREMYR